MAKVTITIWDRPDGSFNVLPQYNADNVFDRTSVAHVLGSMLMAHIDTIGKRQQLTPEEEKLIAEEVPNGQVFS